MTVPARSPLGRLLLAVVLLGGLALALASGVVLHGTVLLTVVVATGLAACLGYTARDDGRAASIDTAWKAAAGVSVPTMLVVGTGVVAGGQAATVLALLAVAGAGAAGVRCRLRTRFSGWTWSSPPPTDVDIVDSPPSPVGLLDRLTVPVSLLPAPALDREWRRTEAALASALEPTRSCAVVRRRQEVLDEFERRDPAGFARWLAAGAPFGADPGTSRHG